MAGVTAAWHCRKGQDERPKARGEMNKSADAFRTISEVAEDLDLPQHVLRFWETRFPQIKPLKRAGGRRFYRPYDIEMLRAIKRLLYGEGYTIKGVQRLLKEQGARVLTAATFEERQSDLNVVSHAAQDMPQSETTRSNDRSGQGSDAQFRHASQVQPAPSNPVETASAAAHAGGVICNAEFAWPPALFREDLARLKAVLTELEACRQILKSVHRP
jgi:DNA-binding transcriptional MerR regulator